MLFALGNLGILKVAAGFVALVGVVSAGTYAALSPSSNTPVSTKEVDEDKDVVESTQVTEHQQIQSLETSSEAVKEESQKQAISEVISSGKPAQRKTLTHAEWRAIALKYHNQAQSAPKSNHSWVVNNGKSICYGGGTFASKTICISN